jgi:hypothetical protein
MITHGLTLVRSDQGDGGWNLHDGTGHVIADGPAHLRRGEWDRPDQADDKAQSYHDDDYNEIMDGKVAQTDDYVTRPGNHYRWS